MHKLVFVDVSILVYIECADELAGTTFVEPRYLHGRPNQLVDRQQSVTFHIQMVEVLHYPLLTALSRTSQNTTSY